MFHRAGETAESGIVLNSLNSLNSLSPCLLRASKNTKNTRVFGQKCLFYTSIYSPLF